MIWAEAWRQVSRRGMEERSAGPDDVLDDSTHYHEWFFIPELPDDENDVENYNSKTL
jgi:hypothetical protein